VRLRSLTCSLATTWCGTAAARLLLLPPRFVRAPVVFHGFAASDRSVSQRLSVLERSVAVQLHGARAGPHARGRGAAQWRAVVLASSFSISFCTLSRRESVHDAWNARVDFRDVGDVDGGARARDARAVRVALRVRELKLNSGINVAPHHIDVSAAEQQWLESQLADDIADYERAVLRLVRHAASAAGELSSSVAWPSIASAVPLQT
jgi:hypothetical protein